MNNVEAYKLYKSLKLHFNNPKYDFFKYKGRVTVSEQELNKSNYWIKGLAKEYDKKLPSFLVANLSENPRYYIRELYSNPNAARTYREWSGMRKAHKYNFLSDLNKISNNLHEELHTDEALPLLIKRYIRREVSKETVCIILRETNALSVLNEQQKGNILWDQYNFGFEKYMPFAIKKEEYNKILLDKFGEISYK